jgi:DNA-directed RNA polymerase specialized sigma24 family protein
MYKILDVIHDKSDHGLYRAGVIRLKASGKMIECFELAIDLLLLLTTEQRQIIWSRANNFSYAEIGKMLGIERRKVKRLYLDALFDCEGKIKKDKDLLAKVDKIH